MWGPVVVVHGAGAVERNTVVSTRTLPRDSAYRLRKTIILRIAVAPIQSSSGRSFVKEDIVLTAQNGGDNIICARGL